MIAINDATLRDIKYIIHYKGGMSKGDCGVKDLIDKIDNINRNFILSYKKIGFFQRVFDFIKEIANIKVKCDFILEHNKYEEINDFFFLNSLNKKVINSDRVTINYCNLNNEISSFLQRRMKNDIDENEFINSYLKNNIKTKGDFLLLYSILNNLMYSIENKNNENILKQTSNEESFKFISRNDIFYKESIFKLLDSIYDDGGSEENKIRKIKNIGDLKKINKVNKEDSIINLIKFIHNLKEKEMRSEIFLLKLENTLINIKTHLSGFENNPKIQTIVNNLKVLLPSYMQEVMMNDNKSINFDFEVYETFDNSNDIYKDKIKLIFDEYKEKNRNKASYIKNIISEINELELNEANVNSYLQFNQNTLNDLLSYLK
ncbi:hypothetical protein [Proteus columbae]|uniref:hypothetical protein n=1 Tax=Proteus columbae TaxID=1987580 RepID=UPI000C1F18C4|nr:hypothetical protein [Proteus columbae]